MGAEDPVVKQSQLLWTLYSSREREQYTDFVKIGQALMIRAMSSDKAGDQDIRVTRTDLC